MYILLGIPITGGPGPPVIDIAAESVHLHQYLAMQQAQMSAQQMGIGMRGMQLNLLQ